jgi:3D (Asp-Asp-Asp) domain-containing protein
MSESEAEIYNGVFTISGYYCKRVVGYSGFDSGGFCGEGASGLGTISGRTAACGPQWSFGTTFYIEGYGPVICTDRGGKVGRNHIDIYFDTDRELYNTPFPRVANVTVGR